MWSHPWLAPMNFFFGYSWAFRWAVVVHESTLISGSEESAGHLLQSGRPRRKRYNMLQLSALPPEAARRSNQSLRGICICWITHFPSDKRRSQIYNLSKDGIYANLAHGYLLMTETKHTKYEMCRWRNSMYHSSLEGAFSFDHIIWPLFYLPASHGHVQWKMLIRDIIWEGTFLKLWLVLTCTTFCICYGLYKAMLYDSVCSWIFWCWLFEFFYNGMAE